MKKFTKSQSILSENLLYYFSYVTFRQETRTEKVVEKRGKVDTTPPETRPHLTRVRKEVILEFLRERPRASRDELTSIESVREIIQRLRQRNKRTGACTENDVQNWLSNPVFELVNEYIFVQKFCTSILQHLCFP